MAVSSRSLHVFLSFFIGSFYRVAYSPSQIIKIPSQTIKQASKKDWKASAWILERRFNYHRDGVHRKEDPVEVQLPTNTYDLLKEQAVELKRSMMKAEASQSWQAYAALLPIKTVGVMGDNRTYEYMCLLRAITSEDGMTADFFNFSKDFMQVVSNKIINNIKGINRVVYDITSKPPSTIELE